jgi:alpha-beta hydrolase superfamily lysophospholipase
MIPAPGRLAAPLAGQRVLVAYGLLGDVVSRLGVDYMRTQVSWMRGTLGADVTVVNLPTSAAVADNARKLRASLVSDPRPALVVAHSKGGLEALEAMLDPSAAPHTRALIALQCPFLGSPVADAILRTDPVHVIARGAAWLVGAGSGRGLADLTMRRRAVWMEAHRAEIAALVARLPVVCVAAIMDDTAPPGPDRNFRPLAQWIEKHGHGPNDGLVTVSSALLPGARHMVIRAGHRGTVSPGRNRDPLGVLRRALDMAL